MHCFDLDVVIVVICLPVQQPSIHASVLLSICLSHQRDFNVMKLKKPNADNRLTYQFQLSSSCSLNFLLCLRSFRAFGHFEFFFVFFTNEEYTDFVVLCMICMQNITQRSTGWESITIRARSSHHLTYKYICLLGCIK